MLPQPSTRLWLSTRATRALLIKLLSSYYPLPSPAVAVAKIHLALSCASAQCSAPASARLAGEISVDSDSRRRGASGLASAAFSATQDAEAALGSPDLARRRAGTVGAS